MKYMQRPTLALDARLTLYTHLRFWLPSPPTYDAYVGGILFSVFHIMFTKKTQGISSKLFVLGRKFFDFVTWRSSTLRNVQISYQCATRFKKTPEWVVGFIILLVYTHIHISFIQHKFPIWDMIIGP